MNKKKITCYINIVRVLESMKTKSTSDCWERYAKTVYL
jgi:hypothetical protein